MTVLLFETSRAVFGFHHRSEWQIRIDLSQRAKVFYLLVIGRERSLDLHCGREPKVSQRDSMVAKMRPVSLFRLN